uniref:Uncharacterized protein n=1 Tax=Daphnia galeata TaxID=27404 RepID=A0A8J2WK18_9CRUS|nr:unnamed protein product [Daphnia galeata]
MQLEDLQKSLMPVQDGIIALIKLTAKLTKDTEKAEAAVVLGELSKADESMRDRLFVLQKEIPVKQIDIEHKETQHAQAKFSPRSIHSEEVREFWKKELNANEWVMLTLEEGYVIPFKEFLPKYEEPSNA